MRATAICFLIISKCLTAAAAPAPIPVVIDSQFQEAPRVEAFRSNERTFRVSFKDGGAASDLTNTVPFMHWGTNALAAGVSTSSWAFVGATSNGMVDFTFSPAALNYTAGRYVYEAGVIADDSPRTYRQGVMQILPSQIGSGASAVTWTTRVDWNAVTWTNLPTSWTDPTARATATNALAVANSKLSVEADPIALPIAAFASNTASTIRGSFTAGTNLHVGGIGSVALGCNSVSTNAFVWNNPNPDFAGAASYSDHGAGTFNINPEDGPRGFWIGGQTFADYFVPYLTEWTFNNFITGTWNAVTGTFVTVESDPDFKAWENGGHAGVLTAEADPIFSGWVHNGYQGVLTTETDPQYQEWVNGGYQGVVTAEADPLSLYLDQTTPQTTVGTFTFPRVIAGTVTDDTTSSMQVQGGVIIKNASDTCPKVGLEDAATGMRMSMLCDWGNGGIADWTLNTTQSGGYYDETVDGPLFRLDIRSYVRSWQVLNYNPDSLNGEGGRNLDYLMELNFGTRTLNLGYQGSTGVALHVTGNLTVDGASIITPPTDPTGLPVGALWNSNGVAVFVTE